MKLPFFEHIRAIPVFRPLLFYILGWLFAHSCPKVLDGLSKDAIHFLLILTLFSFLFRKYFNNWTQIILVLSSFFLIGVYSSGKDEEPGFQSGSEMVYLAEAVDPPIEKEKSTLIKLKLIYCFTDSFTFYKTIYINSYFEKTDEEIVLPEIGEQCIIKTRLIPVKNNGNPYEFDYATWLKRKSIFFTAYVKMGSWYRTGVRNEKFLYKCKSFREWLKCKIIDFKRDEFIKEKAVLLAITLGSKEFLDPGLKSDFADAGAIHVMAVSGLHVGLIWIFIGFLTGFLESTFIGRIVQFFLILSILWTYACITGLSPSVTRSCLMFSLVSFGSVIMRDSSVFNTVLLSAFLQLLIKPNLIMDVGFQFSYAAVLSILFFQPLIKNLFKSQSVIMNWFYDLISVSIAAQVLTFPLAIFYFHQFPVYFILSNIFVIPLVTLLMMVFIGSIFFLMVPFIYNILLSILIFLCSLMIHSVNFIALMPFSTAESLTINMLQMGLLLLSALLFLIFIQYRKLKSFKFAILILSIFFYLGIYKYSESLNNKVLILNVPNALAVDILFGNNHYLIHNLDQSTVLHDLSYYADNYWIRSYSYPPVFIPIDSIENFGVELSYQALPGKSNFILTLADKNIVFIGDFEGISFYKGDSLMDNEALLIFDPDFKPKSEEQKIFKPGEIIIAPTCKLYSSWFSSLNENYYFVREQGSISIDL